MKNVPRGGRGLKIVTYFLMAPLNIFFLDSAENSICTIGYIDVSSIEVITVLPSSQPIDISEVAILGDADAVTSSSEPPVSTEHSLTNFCTTLGFFIQLRTISMLSQLQKLCQIISPHLAQ